MPTLTERLYDDAITDRLDPFAVFEEWFAAARESEPNDANAMAVATVDARGQPDVRMVLMNARDARGFVFFTNFDSAKGAAIAGAAQAAAGHALEVAAPAGAGARTGQVVPPEEADAYFLTRSRGSQIASSASPNSRGRSTAARRSMRGWRS